MKLFADEIAEMKRLGATAFASTALFFIILSFFPAFSRDFSDFGMPQEQPPAKSKPKPTGDDKAPPPRRTPKIAPAIPTEPAVPTVPPEPKIGDMWTDPVSGIDFMWVPGGEFVMGCSGAWAGECYDDEKPARQVTVRGFWLGRTEVTQAQWQRVMGNNPSEFKGANLPVDSVSWNDAQAFIHALNGRGNGVFQLPSESGWEYACRSGGKAERYCGGKNADELAWHDGNAGKRTHPVAGLRANSLGLYDMSGNVNEWVEDCYENNYQKAPLNGQAWTAEECEYRVMRGGSWFSILEIFLRSTLRFRDSPGFRFHISGFRVARTFNP